MPSTNFHQIFSTPIMVQSHEGDEKLHDALIKTIKDLEKAHTSSDLHRSHVGGFYTPGDLFEKSLPGIGEIKAIIFENVKTYINQVRETGCGRKQIIPDHQIRLNGWAALTRKGNYQAPHVHAGSNISGIYYLQVPSVPEPQGNIDLLNPVILQEMTFIPGGATTHCRIVPSPGMLLIFPAYLQHIVHPFENDEERIIIVFNARVYGDGR
ncbi:MAG: 2OG-Fe(II) oxygenase family protein [Flavobacteriales bacterium]|nr:2OG-Fe(II) oxygenase family protein [Flavobacteriales bacterium]